MHNFVNGLDLALETKGTWRHDRDDCDIALKYSCLSGLDWGLAMSGRSDSGHRVATLGSKHGQAGAVPLFPM